MFGRLWKKKSKVEARQVRAFLHQRNLACFDKVVNGSVHLSSLHKAIDITNKEVDLINDALLKQEELKKITEESYKDHILNVISTMVFDK